MSLLQGVGCVDLIDVNRKERDREKTQWLSHGTLKPHGEKMPVGVWGCDWYTWEVSKMKDNRDKVQWKTRVSEKGNGMGGWENKESSKDELADEGSSSVHVQAIPSEDKQLLERTWWVISSFVSFFKCRWWAPQSQLPVIAKHELGPRTIYPERGADRNE